MGYFSTALPRWPWVNFLMLLFCNIKNDSNGEVVRSHRSQDNYGNWEIQLIHEKDQIFAFRYPRVEEISWKVKRDEKMEEKLINIIMEGARCGGGKAKIVQTILRLLPYRSFLSQVLLSSYNKVQTYISSENRCRNKHHKLKNSKHDPSLRLSHALLFSLKSTP